jgi:hypothetical protein
MATTGLVNLAESLLNQTATAQVLQALPATNATGAATAGAVNTQAILDEFVPSSQTGAANATPEAAGLFTAAQIPLFTEAANSLLAQTAPAQTSLAVAPGNTVAPLVPPLVSLVEGTAQTPIQTIPTPAPAAATPAAATLAVAVAEVQAGTNGNATANVAPVATTQQPAAASATNNPSAFGATTAASTGTLASQAQLQKLNNSLAALGLSTAAIKTVDQIANAINDFNPDAYSNLVYQLEAAAQAAASQTPASNFAPASTPTAVTQAPATHVGAVNGPAVAGVNTDSGTFALPGA